MNEVILSDKLIEACDKAWEELCGNVVLEGELEDEFDKLVIKYLEDD